MARHSRYMFATFEEELCPILTTYAAAVCVVEKFRIRHLAFSMLTANTRANVTIRSYTTLAICNQSRQVYTHKRAHCYDEKHLPSTCECFPPYQGILQSPKSNCSNEKYKDCHADKRYTERLTNDIEPYIRIWVLSMLNSEELCNNCAGHYEDKRSP